MNYEEILQQFKKQQLKPVYFFTGEEPYFIDLLTHVAEETILSPAEQSFNQTVFYGKDADWKTLLETLNRYPMMAARQVVILKEAHQFKDWEHLENYLTKPTPTTVFVVGYKNTLDKRKKFSKLVVKNNSIEYFESNAMKEYEIENWIKEFVHTQGYKIRTQTATLLKEYLGTNLQVIVNEVKKLTMNIPNTKEINDEDVEKYIGISKDYNVFELQKAIATRDMLKAQRFVNYCKANPKANALPLVYASLYGYFSKLFLMHNTQPLNDATIASVGGLNPRNATALQEYKVALKNYNIRKVERAFGLLQDYDLKFKGVNNVSLDDGDLLQELTIKLMN